MKYVNLKSILALLLVGSFALTSCNKESDSDPQPQAEGVDNKDFSLKSSDGETVALKDYSDKVVVLFFLGNTCPACKAVAPDVDAAFKDNDDVVVLGIDQWDGSDASLDAFKESTGVSFPLLLNGSAVAKEYSATYDRLVVLDKDGMVIFTGTQGASADLDMVKQKAYNAAGITMDEEEPAQEEEKPMVEEEAMDEKIVETKGDAPDFTLKSLDGTDVSLMDYKDKVVVLFFLGNACPACKAAVPSIQSNIVEAYADRSDVMVVGIDQWNGSETALEAFKTSTSASFPLLLNGSQVASDYGTSFDKLVVINKEGNVTYTGTRSASSDVSTVVTKINMELGL